MSEANTQTNTQTQEPSSNQQQNTSYQHAFDYDKLANLIAGKQTVAEDTVLKSYFKQQGLSADEMSQAISSFKEQKAKNTPDIGKLQSDIAAAKSAQLKAVINQNATLEAVRQGVDVKSIPYVLKMADFKEVADDKGNLNSEKLSEAVKKVLDDIPALKSVQKGQNGGVQVIGGDGGNQNNTTDDMLRSIFGIKPKN